MEQGNNICKTNSADCIDSEQSYNHLIVPITTKKWMEITQSAWHSIGQLSPLSTLLFNSFFLIPFGSAPAFLLHPIAVTISLLATFQRTFWWPSLSPLELAICRLHYFCHLSCLECLALVFHLAGNVNMGPKRDYFSLSRFVLVNWNIVIFYFVIKRKDTSALIATVSQLKYSNILFLK